MTMIIMNRQRLQVAYLAKRAGETKQDGGEEAHSRDENARRRDEEDGQSSDMQSRKRTKRCIKEHLAVLLHIHVAGGR